MNIKEFLSKYSKSESRPEAIAALYDVLRKNAKVVSAEVGVDELKVILGYGNAIPADQNIFNDESERILAFIKLYDALGEGDLFPLFQWNVLNLFYYDKGDDLSASDQLDNKIANYFKNVIWARKQFLDKFKNNPSFNSCSKFPTILVAVCKGVANDLKDKKYRADLKKQIHINTEPEGLYFLAEDSLNVAALLIRHGLNKRTNPNVQRYELPIDLLRKEGEARIGIISSNYLGMSDYDHYVKNNPNPTTFYARELSSQLKQYNLEALLSLAENDRSWRNAIPCRDQDELCRLLEITQDKAKFTEKLVTTLMRHSRFWKKSENAEKINMLISSVLSCSKHEDFQINFGTRTEGAKVLNEALTKEPSLCLNIVNNKSLCKSLDAKQLARLAVLDKSGKAAEKIVSTTRWKRFWNWLSFHPSNKMVDVDGETLADIAIAHSDKSQVLDSIFGKKIFREKLTNSSEALVKLFKDNNDSITSRMTEEKDPEFKQALYNAITENLKNVPDGKDLAGIAIRHSDKPLILDVIFGEETFLEKLKASPDALIKLFKDNDDRITSRMAEDPELNLALNAAIMQEFNKIKNDGVSRQVKKHDFKKLYFHKLTNKESKKKMFFALTDRFKPGEGTYVKAQIAAIKYLQKDDCDAKFKEERTAGNAVQFNNKEDVSENRAWFDNKGKRRVTRYKGLMFGAGSTGVPSKDGDPLQERKLRM